MKKLCVVFGGASAEHDISIITGMQLAKNYDQRLEKIYIDINNRFFLASKINEVSFFANKQKLKLKEIVFINGAIYFKGAILKKYCDVECVINCCHGGIGENGDLYSFFQVNKIKCTSANSLSSHISMDKNLSKELLRDVVPIIKGLKITKTNYLESIDIIKQDFSLNLIVKPNSLGSSIGVKACDKQNFTDQINAIFELNDDALVEERVVNMYEYNQACFKVEDGLILSAIEQPLTKSAFLTFEDKYQNSKKTKGRDRVIPAQISPELEEQIINYTSKIYNKLNMNGVVRIDYIYDKDKNKLYFNEINTIPGSMAFYLYEPLGIDYISLIKQIVESAKEVQSYSYIDTCILKDKKI